MNIAIKLFVYDFKDNIFNIYSGLSICCNLSINKILISCLASFNCYLTGNNSLFMQLLGQVLDSKFFKIDSQVNYCALVILTALIIICLICW